VLDRVARGKHQDQGLVASGPEPLQHADAVKAGHEPIEHDHVGAVGLHLAQRLVPVGGAEDMKALVLQCTLQHLQELGIVVDDKDSGHRKLLKPCSSLADYTTSRLRRD
jgi:hypothetical protein